MIGSAGKKTIYAALGREPVHPFPARMAPDIALQVISSLTRPLRVLDPMMGSGTVLVMARAAGHKGLGFDIDPLAVLISKVWTTAIDPAEIRDQATMVLDKAQRASARLAVRHAYPPGADVETRAFVRYWFDDYARCQLTALANQIALVQNRRTRDVLWCAFSRTIITKQSGASLAMDLAHSRPHRAYDRAPAKPFRNFMPAVDRVVKNCIHGREAARGPHPYIGNRDARRLPLNDGSIDLVLTSPPYLNAIDYMRASKFSLVWMGYTIPALREIRASSVGTEAAKSVAGDREIRDIVSGLCLRPQLKAHDEAVLIRYISDMRSAVREVARILSAAGRAVYVIGENTVRGTYVRNSKIISILAELSGLKPIECRVRKLPSDRRYLPPPCRAGHRALSARMRREVVLTFSKSIGS